LTTLRNSGLEQRKTHTVEDADSEASPGPEDGHGLFRRFVNPPIE
jgi:hypothetical protein